MELTPSSGSGIIITPTLVYTVSGEYPITHLKVILNELKRKSLLIILAQSSSVIEAVKNTRMKLPKIHSLMLMEMRLMRNDLEILGLIMPNIKTIIFNDVDAASEMDGFDVVFPRLETVNVTFYKRLWIDLIFAKKASVLVLDVVHHKIAEQLTMIIDILRRSQSLQTVHIGELDQNALGDWCKLLPDQWRFRKIEVDDGENSDDGDDDDGVNRQCTFQCTFVRCPGIE